jgi:hypothetical protein
MVPLPAKPQSEVSLNERSSTPMRKVEAEVLRALMCHPALPLDEGFNDPDVRKRCGQLITMGTRHTL